MKVPQYFIDNEFGNLNYQLLQLVKLLQCFLDVVNITENIR